MPSISGMLMSIRTTSGPSSEARAIASRPDAAAPTTVMSDSNPSSLVRWSRVSGMSSTIRTRIWSGMLALSVRSAAIRGRGGLTAGYWGRFWAAITWGGRTPHLSISVFRTIPVVRVVLRDLRLAAGVHVVLGRAQDQGDLAVHLGELDDLGLLGRDREDHELLLARQGRAARCCPRGRAARPARSAAFRTSRSVPAARARRSPACSGGSPWWSWSCSPVTVVSVFVTLSRVASGNLSAPVMPRTRSTRSPTLMSVPTPVLWSTWTAIARRPGSSRCATSCVVPPAPAEKSAGRMSWPCLISARVVLPIDLARIAVGVGIARGDRLVARREHVRLDHGAQRDVAAGVHGRCLRGRGCDRLLALVEQVDHAAERNDREQDPDEEDQAIGPFQDVYSRVV